MPAIDFNDLDYLRVACASPMVSIGSPGDNAVRILELSQHFEAEAVAIGVFPELCITGYSAEDLFFTDALLRDTVLALEQLAKLFPLPLDQRRPRYAKTLALREKPLRILHPQQVELLREWRKAGGELPDALVFNISSVASGLRNTG